MSRLPFPVRLFLTGGGVLVGAVADAAAIAVSPHWDGSFSVAMVGYVSVLGLPGAALIALGVTTTRWSVAASAFLALLVASMGAAMAGSSSSTAALVFIWLPPTSIAVGLVAVAARAWRETATGRREL